MRDGTGVGGRVSIAGDASRREDLAQVGGLIGADGDCCGGKILPDVLDALGPWNRDYVKRLGSML